MFKLFFLGERLDFESLQDTSYPLTFNFDNLELRGNPDVFGHVVRPPLTEMEPRKPDGDAVLPFPPEIDPASMPTPLDADEEELLNKYLASRLSGLYCFTPECITR
jgi:hypothetical protein